VSGTGSGRLRHVLYGLWVVVCLCMLCWPGYAWFGSRIEPYVLGVPFSMIWVIVWVLMSAVVLGLYDGFGPAGED
jgi:hypothetical protein